MRCGDCKYLGEGITYVDDDYNDKQTGYHQCERIKHIGMDGEHMINIQDVSVIVDGSGYFGAIRVKKDFGCVNFKQRG